MPEKIEFLANNIEMSENESVSAVVGDFGDTELQIKIYESLCYARDITGIDPHTTKLSEMMTLIEPDITEKNT